MDVSAGLDVPHPVEHVFPWVADLGRYPQWLTIVRLADPDPTEPHAWTVELRARLGPMARSKRLRMVRADLVADRSARFERAETDGRDHAAWVLEVVVDPTEAGCRLTMRLHYAGGALGPLVQRLLTDEIERSGKRLLDVLAGRSV